MALNIPAGATPIGVGGGLNIPGAVSGGLQIPAASAGTSPQQSNQGVPANVRP